MPDTLYYLRDITFELFLLLLWFVVLNDVCFALCLVFFHIMFDLNYVCNVSQLYMSYVSFVNEFICMGRQPTNNQ